MQSDLVMSCQLLALRGLRWKSEDMPVLGKAQRAYEEPERTFTMVDIKECRQTEGKSQGSGRLGRYIKIKMGEREKERGKFQIHGLFPDSTTASLFQVDMVTPELSQTKGSTRPH